MELFLSVAQAFIKFLDVLELFFFSSLNELLAMLPTQILGWDGTFGQVYEKVLSWIIGRQLGPLADVSIFTLLFGGGALLFLIYKLVLFLVPVAD